MSISMAPAAPLLVERTCAPGCHPPPARAAAATDRRNAAPARAAPRSRRAPGLPVTTAFFSFASAGPSRGEGDALGHRQRLVAQQQRGIPRSPAAAACRAAQPSAPGNRHSRPCPGTASARRAPQDAGSSRTRRAVARRRSACAAGPCRAPLKAMLSHRMPTTARAFLHAVRGAQPAHRPAAREHLARHRRAGITCPPVPAAITTRWCLLMRALHA